MAKILCIEDDPVQRSVLRNILTLAGFDVDVSEDGQAGIEKASSWQPDLIVTDSQMPRLNGLQAIEAIRSQEHLSQTPIIALSARADRRYHELVRQAGANEVLSKPADLTNLVLLIKSYVDQTPAEHLDYQPE